MYQVQPTDPRMSDYRKSMNSSGMLLRSSHLSPTSVSTPRGGGSAPAPRPPLTQNHTMPEQGEYVPESVQRTGSGGFFRFPKRKTKEERQKLSQIRAQELIDLYELNTDKETELNKEANIKTSHPSSPTLVICMSPEQAKLKFEEQQAQRKEPKVDPLMKPHELKNKQRSEEMARRKKIIKECQLLEETTGAPIAHRRIQSQPPAASAEHTPLLDHDPILVPKSRSLPQRDDDYWAVTESEEVFAKHVGISFVAPTLPSDLQAKLFAKTSTFDGGYKSCTQLEERGKSTVHRSAIADSKARDTSFIMC